MYKSFSEGFFSFFFFYIFMACGLLGLFMAHMPHVAHHCINLVHDPISDGKIAIFSMLKDACQHFNSVFVIASFAPVRKHINFLGFVFVPHLNWPSRACGTRFFFFFVRVTTSQLSLFLLALKTKASPFTFSIKMSMCDIDTEAAWRDPT